MASLPSLCPALVALREKAVETYADRMGNGHDGRGPRYEMGLNLGEGTYGVVKKARDNRSGPSGVKDVAIKIIKAGRPDDGMQMRELMLLHEISQYPKSGRNAQPGSQHVIRLLDIFKNPTANEDPGLHLVFEFAETDLAQIRLPMSEAFCRSVLFQIIKGVDFLHSNWIMHRDLKPANILITAEEQGGGGGGVVKLADFGLARIFHNPCRPLYEDGVVVTIWYRAPELLLGSRHYTPAVDIWALGCIFGEMLLRTPIFRGVEETDSKKLQADQLKVIFKSLGKPTTSEWPLLKFMPHYENIQGDEWKPSLFNRDLSSRLREKHPQISSDALDLIHSMLHYDPAKRITVKDALGHSYFGPKNGPLADNVYRLLNAHNAHNKRPYPGKWNPSSSNKKAR